MTIQRHNTCQATSRQENLRILQLNFKVSVVQLFGRGPVKSVTIKWALERLTQQILSDALMLEMLKTHDIIV